MPAPFVRKATAPDEARPDHAWAAATPPAWRPSTRWTKEGIALDYLRVRGFPFGDEVHAFVKQHDVDVRGRAEPRRPAAHTAACSRPACGDGQARVGPLLRGLPDERAPRRVGREGEARGGGMTYIAKPKVHHPSLQKNAIGLTRRDYEGAITTLCAGCGHDSITAAIIQAFWELSIPPHTVAKLSGIGCSSKTPAYFLREAHGFNSVHGRMPAIATGRGRRQRRADDDRRLRRRRLALHRARPALARDPPQREHAVRAGEQRRLRAHQGPVLRLGRPGLDEQEGRGQRDGGHRRRPAGADARGDVRRAQLLGRQGAARAAPQGRPDAQGLRLHRRDLAVRHLQRPRGLHQELRLHARAPGGGGPGRLRRPARGDHLGAGGRHASRA